MQIEPGTIERLNKLLERQSFLAEARSAHDGLLSFSKFTVPIFKAPPHVQLLIEQLEAVERGEVTRLCISVPPRHGKSFLTSELYPAWHLGRNPQHFVIAATYAQELADDFGRKVRNQMIDERYHSIFPGATISDDSRSIQKFTTTQGGSYFAVGAGGPITGRGANLLLIDDIFKGREEADSEATRKRTIDWYRNIAYTRLMPGKSAIVIIGTRWHEEDLIGWVLENTPHEEWTVINLPALAERNDVLGRAPGEPLWPEAFPLERLNNIKKTIGTRAWSSLYQQSPVADEGNIFKRGWWKEWTQEKPPVCQFILQSYDTAFTEKETGGHTAIQTWGIFVDDNNIQQAVLLSCLDESLSYPDLRRKSLELFKKWQPDAVLIEYKASGQSLAQELMRAGIPVIKYNPDRDKVARAHSVAPLVEAGKVWVPKGKVWAEEFVNQCSSFPYSRRKDMVDAFTQAMIYFRRTTMVRHPEDPKDDPTGGMPLEQKFYW